MSNPIKQLGFDNDEPAAYMFQAAIYCSDCIVDCFNPTDVSDDEYMKLIVRNNPEATLNNLASRLGINRKNEHSFDSFDFPKTVSMNELEDDEMCECCTLIIKDLF